LRDYGRPIGFDVFHADVRDIYKMPLVNQPGEKWEYGINIDWAGIVLERATGDRLNNLIQKGIVEPLGLKNITMLPTPEMKKKLASMHQRWPENPSKCEERDHIYREPLNAETEEEQAKLFNSGGAGAYAQPSQYVQVLAALLNNGKSPKNGAQILKPETVDLMWENQIPEHPNFARDGLFPAKAEMSNAAPEMYPQEGECCELFMIIMKSNRADNYTSRQPTSRLGT
jgi:CubicO group peptidase (beta-lactamase class C family)